MRVLLFEWNAYMQQDMEEVLCELGIAYETFSYEFVNDGIYEDGYFERHFERVLRGGDFDAILSLNYWPPIARVCHRAARPYISWIYDCPTAVRHMEETLGFPTNYACFFDRMQYEMFKSGGFNTVYHVPLGVNVERLDKIHLTEEDIGEFQADVSFVGNMYTSEYQKLQSGLTEYEKGYLDSLVNTQYQVYGCFYLDDLLTDEFLRPIHNRLQHSWLREQDEKMFRRWVLRVLSMEITKRERMMIIAAVARRCRFNLYSATNEKMLSDANYVGTVDGWYEMPRVFKASRINLNISFKQIVTGIPLRVMDILGAGGFLLSNYQPELVENFRPGVDCVIYESVEDAVRQVQYYLQHEEERKEIARCGHEAVKRFSYQNQLRKIFNIVFPDER